MKQYVEHQSYNLQESLLSKIKVPLLWIFENDL